MPVPAVKGSRAVPAAPHPGMRAGPSRARPFFFSVSFGFTSWCRALRPGLPCGKLVAQVTPPHSRGNAAQAVPEDGIAALNVNGG